MYEFVYFSGSVIFLAASWCYIKIKSGGRR
jgi:hypothetical protein